MGDHRRFYTGSLPYTAGLIKSARDGLHLELCGLEQRLWTEIDADTAVKEALPGIRANLDDMVRFIREIEDTLTTAEEEQAAAKQEINRDAA